MPAKVISNFLWFVPNGTTIGLAGAAVSRAVPPGDPAGDTADIKVAAYLIPCVEAVDPVIENNTEEVYCPVEASGTYELDDEVNITKTRGLSVTISQLCPLVYRMFFATPAVISGGSDVAILNASGQVEGWCYLLQKDQSGVNIAEALFAAKAQLTSANFNQAVAKATIEFRILRVTAAAAVAAQLLELDNVATS